MRHVARKVDYELSEVQAAGVYIAAEPFRWAEHPAEFVLRVKAEEFARKRFEAYAPSIGVGCRELMVAIRLAGSREVVKVFRFKARVTVQPELVA